MMKMGKKSGKARKREDFCEGPPQADGCGGDGILK
jgi:hypothetical protein